MKSGSFFTATARLSRSVPTALSEISVRTGRRPALELLRLVLRRQLSEPTTRCFKAPSVILVAKRAARTTQNPIVVITSYLRPGRARAKKTAKSGRGIGAKREPRRGRRAPRLEHLILSLPSYAADQLPRGAIRAFHFETITII